MTYYHWAGINFIIAIVLLVMSLAKDKPPWPAVPNTVASIICLLLAKI